MADSIKGTPRSGGAPTYVQEEAAATPAVKSPTDVHEALTASTGANATSIGNLDAKNRRMYKHVPAEQRRDWLEDEAERDRVEANQNAVIEDHVKRLASRIHSRYGHLTGRVDVDAKFPPEYLQGASVLPFLLVDGNITLVGADNPEHSPDHDKPVASPGIVYPGTGVQIDPSYKGKLDLKPATPSEIGGVKVGANVSVSEDGTISTDVNKAYVDEKVAPIPSGIIAKAVGVEAPSGTGFTGNSAWYEGYYDNGPSGTFVALRARLSLTTSAEFGEGSNIVIHLPPVPGSTFGVLGGSYHLLYTDSEAIPTQVITWPESTDTLTIPVIFGIAAGTIINIIVL